MTKFYNDYPVSCLITPTSEVPMTQSEKEAYFKRMERFVVPDDYVEEFRYVDEELVLKEELHVSPLVVPKRRFLA